MKPYDHENLIELYFGNKIAPRGYVWIFPKAQRKANVGIGIGGNVINSKKLGNLEGAAPKPLLDEFIKNIPNYYKIKKSRLDIHEYRSIIFLEYIIKKHNIKIDNNQFQVIKDLIYPKISTYELWDEKYKIGKWIFQIISNPVNDIDVDKMDYIVRDNTTVGLKLSFDPMRIIKYAKAIDDNICYSTRVEDEIYNMFYIRYRLHKQIYNHKTIKSIEILILNIFYEFEKTTQISDYLFDINKMMLLDDMIIWQYKLYNNKVKNIINNINIRAIPKLIYEKISLDTEEFDYIKKILTENYHINTYKIIEYTAGYSNNNNPLNNILFYRKQNIKRGDFSLLLNGKYKEYIFRVYCLNPSNVEMFDTIIKMFNIQKN
jgi:hypothetical protein